MTRKADPSTVPLGKVIQDAREALDMNQAELAAALNATQQTISRWESGRMIPTIDRLPAIAKALKIKVETLTAAAVRQAVDSPPAQIPNRVEALEERFEQMETRIGSIDAKLDLLVSQLGLSDEPKPTQPARQRARAGRGKERAAKAG